MLLQNENSKNAFDHHKKSVPPWENSSMSTKISELSTSRFSSRMLWESKKIKGHLPNN